MKDAPVIKKHSWREDEFSGENFGEDLLRRFEKDFMQSAQNFHRLVLQRILNAGDVKMDRKILQDIEQKRRRFLADWEYLIYDHFSFGVNEEGSGLELYLRRYRQRARFRVRLFCHLHYIFFYNFLRDFGISRDAILEVYKNNAYAMQYLSWVAVRSKESFSDIWAEYSDLVKEFYERLESEGAGVQYRESVTSNTDALYAGTVGMAASRLHIMAKHPDFSLAIPDPYYDVKKQIDLILVHKEKFSKWERQISKKISGNNFENYLATARNQAGTDAWFKAVLILQNGIQPLPIGTLWFVQIKARYSRNQKYVEKFKRILGQNCRSIANRPNSFAVALARPWDINERGKRLLVNNLSLADPSSSDSLFNISKQYNAGLLAMIWNLEEAEELIGAYKQ